MLAEDRFKSATDREGVREIIQRLLAVKPNMTRDQLMKKAMQAMKKVKCIRPLPKLSLVAKMTLQEL